MQYFFFTIYMITHINTVWIQVLKLHCFIMFFKKFYLANKLQQNHKNRLTNKDARDEYRH